MPTRAAERDPNVRPVVVPVVCSVTLGMLALILLTAVVAQRKPFSGFYWIRGSGEITHVFPDTPAHEAGLRRNDVILEINGEPTRSTVWRSVEAYSSGRLGEYLELEVRRDDDVRRVRLPLIEPPLLERLHTLEIPVIALLLVLFAFVIWAHKPLDLRVVLFLCLIYAVAALLAVGWLAILGKAWALVGYDLFLALSSALLVHLHLAFPRVRRAAARWPLLVGLYGLALAPPLLYLPALGQQSDRFWYFLALDGSRLYAGVATITAAILLLHSYRTTPSVSDRRRIRLVAFGTLLAIGPVVSLSIVPELVDPQRAFFVPYEITLPFLLTLPVAYAVAIQRHELLRIDRFINRSVVNTVLVLMMATVYLAIVVTLPRLWPESWAGRPVTWGLVALIVGLLFSPLRQRLQTLADRLFYGGWYDHRSLLGEMNLALAGVVDVRELCDLLVGRAPELLHVRGASLLLAVGDGNLVIAESRDWREEIPSLPLPSRGAVTATLTDRARPVDSRELEQLVSGIALDENERRWIAASGAELWVPLVQRGSLEGVLVLGPKAGHDPYDDEDRRLLAALSSSAAVAVVNIQLVSALRRRADEVNQLYLRLVESREEERKRLARELHDLVIQDLVNLHFSLAKSPGDKAALEGATDSLRDSVREIIDKLRAVCAELRPSAIDDLGFCLAVRGHVDEEQEKHGLRIDVELPEDEERLDALPEEVRLSLFRVLEAALANVCQHAQARRVEVRLSVRGDRVSLAVVDDGVGFRCPASLSSLIPLGHFGLAGMQERMNLVGGDLRIDSEPGRGTCLEAHVPLPHREARDRARSGALSRLSSPGKWEAP